MRRYEIRLAAQLDAGWSSWFEGFTLTRGAEGSTVLTGTVRDQAALHGVLRRVGDLGVALLSINILNDDIDRSPGQVQELPLFLTGRQTASIDDADGGDQCGECCREDEGRPGGGGRRCAGHVLGNHGPDTPHPG